MFFLGACFAYQVGLIIVAHLTKTPFPFFNVLLLPIFVGVVDATGPYLREKTGGLIGWPSALGEGPYEVAYVFLCMGLSLGIYGSFVVSTLRPMWLYCRLTLESRSMSSQTFVTISIYGV